MNPVSTNEKTLRCPLDIKNKSGEYVKRGAIVSVKYLHSIARAPQISCVLVLVLVLYKDWVKD